MNEQIFGFLNVYATIPSPRYAIMLRGKWGCGKTYFVKKWLADFGESSKHPSDENSIELRPIYVSLFGMREIKDIKTAIDRSVNPFFYSRKGKLLKIAGRIASKIIFKTELDLGDNGKGETSFFGTLDSLSVFESDDKEVSGVKFIIFDDLECCQIPMKQLLGFINYFVEHCDCHVVVVGEEKYLDENPLQELQEFKEKVIGREFEILPDVDSAVKLFVSQPMMATGFLEKGINTIKLCFECTGYHNLRLLRQSLLDFSLLISSLPANLVESNHEYLRSLLSCFIAVYAEYRSKEGHTFIVDWEQCYTKAVFGEDENAGRVRELAGKYDKLNSNAPFEVLSTTLVPKIVGHIEKGANLAPTFQKILSEEDKKLSALDNLASYWDKTNEEFDDAYSCLIDELQNGFISEPVGMGKSVAYLGYFDAKDIKKVPNGVAEKIAKRLKEMFLSCTSLSDLYRCRYQFMQGYNYVGEYGQDKGMIDEVGKIFEERKEQLPDDMQMALRQLSDANVCNLVYLDRQVYPDHSSAFQLRPIFAKESPQQLFESLCTMSNKGRNTFSQFLSVHCELHTVCGYSTTYKPDHDVLVELRHLLEKEAVSKKSIEKMSYDGLLENLDKSIRRANGEERM